MTRRTRLSLVYAASDSSRWSRTAASTPDSHLLERCAWRWKNASAAQAHADAQRPALRLPQPGDFLPLTARKPYGK